jgi:hypothetical protein
VPTALEIAAAVAAAPTWNARVALIRKVPEDFGIAQHQAVYAAIADRVYVPTLKPEFAYVHWRDEYELAPVQEVYRLAHEETVGFTRVGRDDLARLISQHPHTLRIFRLLLGYIPKEFAEACRLVATKFELPSVTTSSVGTMERGRRPTAEVASTCAHTIDLVMNRAPDLFPVTPEGSALRLKIEKPDTAHGWESVRRYALDGVPLAVLLHQRAYGGAFRQLLDATSGVRGDLVEDPVETFFAEERIPYIRTGSHNQAAIEERFGLTVRPAPDFVIFDNRNDQLRAVLECKGANDGGTARDKAGRFALLRAEGQRLGGVPVFAVLAGIGWRRTADALGPVVRDTDGRVFTLATLPRILETEPMSGLRGLVG